jgi:hypothetical protein
VKILMPVVVKNADGQAVTDLKASDFQVSGFKGTQLEKMWLVPPETVSAQDTHTPVYVLYDAANSDNAYPEVKLKWLRGFLGNAARNRTPVTFFVNTGEAVELVYSPATTPEILSAALQLTENAGATSPDKEVQEQANRLKLLATNRIRNIRYDQGNDQAKSLADLSHLLPQTEGRKVVLWLASPVYLPRREEMFGETSRNQTWDSRPMYEVAVEQLNAVHASVYTDVFTALPDAQVHALVSENTGGLCFSGDPNPVQTILADFGPYYLLGVQAPTPYQNGWVPIKIKVNRTGVTVRAATGFFGLKPGKIQSTHP